ncbi:hypothetical protein [Ferribacterium limneticum]|uniref:hypothetical protein n=1 Tax=Ferribacterium limneticum TaxID=76259 RepID=UPI001CFA7A81|nr:hypothetical protein [Ferribacterium limneticum]UCV29051.1 hypothetical protein KI617_02830 [Ferribacterium limneticum]UCV32969.1 hypothetical protein KI608_02830 [Ferribacterium limneticum]
MSMVSVCVGAAPQSQPAACEPINDDPLLMTNGVLPSDDPILRFRSPACAASFGQRQSER